MPFNKNIAKLKNLENQLKISKWSNLGSHASEPVAVMSRLELERA